MNTIFASLPFSHFFSLHRAVSSDASFFIAQRKRGGRFYVCETAYVAPQTSGWFAQKIADSDLVGDNPQRYHARYVMAILSAKRGESVPLLRFSIPQIAFETDENVRRSMTLNSMRMSLEHLQSGSLRVLDLVENRLKVGQRDVVHDLCVYLMRHLLDIRATEREARLLRAEAVAAFLGLYQQRVEPLFLTPRVSSKNLAAVLQSGELGTSNRVLDVETLLENQIALLRPQLRDFAAREQQVLWLLDEVVTRLRTI